MWEQLQLIKNECWLLELHPFIELEKTISPKFDGEFGIFFHYILSYIFLHFFTEGFFPICHFVYFYRLKIFLSRSVQFQIN